MKTKFKIINENGLYVPYKKRKLLGWKRLITGSFPTIYIAIEYLSKNYGTPILNFDEITIENQC